MKIQIMLHQGPFDGHIMTHGPVTDAPASLRIADGDDSADPVEAHNYRRHDVDEKGTIYMGSYIFTHSFESKRSLIEVWL